MFYRVLNIDFTSQVRNKSHEEVPITQKVNCVDAEFYTHI